MRIAKTVQTEREAFVTTLLTDNPNLTIKEVNVALVAKFTKTMATKTIQALRKGVQPAAKPTLTIVPAIVEPPAGEQ